MRIRLAERSTPCMVLLITCCILWLFVQIQHFKIPLQMSGTKTLSSLQIILVITANYIYLYNSNLRCAWLIDAGSTNEIVVIDIIVWALEDTYDVVSFYDGDINSPLIGGISHSGTSSAPFTVRSTGRYLYLHFYSDYSVTRTGFRFTYYSQYGVATSTPTPAPSTVITTSRNFSSCNSYIALASGETKHISSPNWPYTYNNNLNCTIYVVPDSSSLKVKLTVQTFHTQSDRDILYIYDGSFYHDVAEKLKRLKIIYSYINSDYQIAALSGTPSVPLYYSSTLRYLRLLFNTDGSNVYSGFTMMVETELADIPACVSGYSPLTYLNISTATAYFQSPNYPSNYDNNNLEYWLITKMDEAQTLMFEIINFRLEAHSSCNYDSLTIYQGACTDSGILYKLCDHKTGYYTHTYGKYALVEFKTDSSVTRAGFRLSVYLGDYQGVATSTEKSAYDDSENGIIVAAIVIPVVIITVCVLCIICKARASRNRPTVSTPKPKEGITVTLKQKVDKTPSGRQKKNVVMPQQPSMQPPLQHQIWTQPPMHPLPSAPPIEQYSDPAYPPIYGAYMPNYSTAYAPTPQASNIPDQFEYKPYTYS